MRSGAHTLLGVFAREILRADLSDGEWHCTSSPRPAGLSVAEAFDAARDGRDGFGRKVWLVSDEWFSQTIHLNPTQIAGLGDGQLERALAFEAEPFSGMSMTSSALGFRRTGAGDFEVVVVPADLRTRLIQLAGGAFGGIAFASAPPDDGSARSAWLHRLLGGIEGGEVPLVRTPKAPPSAGRFRRAATVMALVALAVVLTARWRIVSETRALRAANAEFSAAAAELANLNNRIQAAGGEIAGLREEMERFRILASRRLALASLLRGLALQRPDEIVLRGFDAEGPSSSVVRGLSLNSEAVDEFALVLRETLRASGWSVHQGRRKGLRNLPNGGPWEFSLTVVHAGTADAISANRETEDTQ